MATKTCADCGRDKLLNEFYPKTGVRGTKYAGTPAGYSHQCKECDKQARHLYVVNNPDKTKESDRAYHLSRYGISVSDYNALFTEQEGRCCGRRIQYQNGKIRGLLCSSCNSLLGMAKDSTSTLSNLINYLTNSESAANKNNTDTKVG